MFRTLLTKEIMVHLKTFRFNAALITLFILIMLSVWILGNDFATRNNLYNKLNESYAENWNRILVPAQFTSVLHKPPSHLSIFAQGQERDLGNTVNFSRWSVPFKATNSLTNNPLSSPRITFDLTTIFTLVISLFSLLITYDAICGEREAGTLKLISSYGLSRALIYTVKFTAGIIVIALPYLISFISSLLVLNVLHRITFNSEQWLAIALMALAGLIYITLFTAVGLFCSSVAHRVSASLVLSLLLWTIFVLAIPSAGNSIAKIIVPLHPPEEIDKFEQESGSELKTKLSEFIANEASRTGSGSWKYGYILDENVAMSDTFNTKAYNDNINYYRFQEKLNQERADKLWAILQKHLNRQREQAELAGNITALSPALQLRSAFTYLSGTDYTNYKDFMEKCRRYRTTVLNTFRRRGYFGDNMHEFFILLPREKFIPESNFLKRQKEMMALVESGVSFNELFAWTDKVEPLKKDSVPAFDYTNIQSHISQSLSSFMSLSMMVLIVFIAGFSVFLRYDVR